MGKGLRPIRVMRGEEPAHADGVQHHQIDVHARGRAGQVQRARLDHGGNGMLGSLAHSPGPCSGSLSGAMVICVSSWSRLRAMEAGRSLPVSSFVLAVDRGGQFLVRVLALVPHGQFALLSADHVVEQGLDLCPEFPFHVVRPERRAFQAASHVRALACSHGLVMLDVVRGIRLVGVGARHLGEVFFDVAHAMVLSP